MVYSLTPNHLLALSVCLHRHPRHVSTSSGQPWTRHPHASSSPLPTPLCLPPLPRLTAGADGTLICGLTPTVSVTQSATIQKCYMENSRNNASLSSTKEPRTALPVHLGSGSPLSSTPGLQRCLPRVTAAVYQTEAARCCGGPGDRGVRHCRVLERSPPLHGGDGG